MQEHNKEGSKTEKRNKRPAVIFAISIAVCAIVIIVLICAQQFSSSPGVNTNDTLPNFDYTFCDADFNEDIFADDEYLAKDRLFYFCDMTSGGWQVVVDTDALENYGEVISFFNTYINSIIYGDVDEYNKCLSDLYIAASGKQQKFTMQKVYDILLTKYSEKSESDGAGEYVIYTFSLEYKIMDNNGTFRRDIGSDMNRKQYISVIERNGVFSIEGIHVNF